MKKLFLLIALLVLTVSASAQTVGTPSNPFGGDIRASSAACATAASCVWQKLPSTATTLTATITGTFVATLQFEQSSDGITFVAASPASTSTTGVTTFTVTSFTDFRVRASAYVSGMASVSLQASGNQLSVTVNSAGSSISPNTSTVPGIYAGASPYNAKFDGRSSQDGSITNTSTTVSSATVACVSADIGKRIFTVNTGTTLSKLNSTVASCSGTDFVSVAPATATESSVNLVVCSDDTTALSTAWTAAIAANLPLYLPAGLGCVASRPFLVPALSVLQQPAQTIVISGAGMNSTVIGMIPAFSFTGAVNGAIFDDGLAQSCTWQNSALHQFTVSTLQDFSVTGFNFNFPSWPAGMPILGSKACQVHRVGIYNITTSSTMIGLSAPAESYIDNMNIQGLTQGATGILMTGSGSTAIGNIIAFGTPGGIGYSVLNCTTECAIVGGFTTSLTTGVKVVNSILSVVDGQISTGSSTTGVTVDATSIVNVARMVLIQNGVSTSVGFNVAAGGKLRFTQLDNIITSGTPTEIINAGSVFDACGNNFTGAITNTGSWFGTCSVTGTALVAGNLVPSANWGTSAAISAPVGDSQFFSFTLTNGSAAVGANPTIAFTFPTAFPRNPICTVQQVGGTQAILAATATLTPSAASTTTITLTYNGTPTVNLTEFYQGECH